jgi:hypothetical protein
MNEVDIRDVTVDNLDDLCIICVPCERSEDPDWIRGAQEKKKWAADMLNTWGSFAKVAYRNGRPVGMIQYRPIPRAQTVSIDCIYVPAGGSTGKGTASRLLSGLIEDVTGPMSWFDNERPLALVTTTFEGGEPGQLTAREFFKKKGFKEVGEDPDHLCYPLKEGFVCRPPDTAKATYISQDEDKGTILLICGPNGCPALYPFFLKRMEKYIKELYPEAAIRWIDAAVEPEELERRSVNIGDCIVNGRPIHSCVLDKEDFQKEVRTAFEDPWR